MVTAQHELNGTEFSICVRRCCTLVDVAETHGRCTIVLKITRGPILFRWYCMPMYVAKMYGHCAAGTEHDDTTVIVSMVHTEDDGAKIDGRRA